ncbi:cation transporting ATPase C-terminal domain-containing protein [Desulfocurvus vexinensis]|uniref:cation transporting ATPase C-terminal domain-containing protein n=1 Tax=Desulfocurvus vexinensis TaxID=399548 RepID=UPI001FDF1FCB|nr:cation transporting ATPase C-terminal domain-containing protein [Desulfocurvus vexinensis]
MLLLAIGVTLTLQLILIYIPFFNPVFRTKPLRTAELGICAVGALVFVNIGN